MAVYRPQKVQRMAYFVVGLRLQGQDSNAVLFQHGHELALLCRADEDQIRLDCQDLFHIDAIDRPHFRYVLIALGDRRVSGADRRAAHEIALHGCRQIYERR